MPDAIFAGWLIFLELNYQQNKRTGIIRPEVMLSY